MKVKLFASHEIQYFELGIVSFSSYIYYVTGGFIASTRAFSLLSRAFNLPTPAFSLLTRAFSVRTREFELVTRNSSFTFLQFLLSFTDNLTLSLSVSRWLGGC